MRGRSKLTLQLRRTKKIFYKKEKFLFATYLEIMFTKMV